MSGDISSVTVDVLSPSRVLVNGRAYVIPPGCRFIAFRLADGAPVDNETKLPLPEAIMTGSECRAVGLLARRLRA